jgi:rhomboid protease GluP
MSGRFDRSGINDERRPFVAFFLIILNCVIFVSLPLAFKQQYPSHPEFFGADWGPLTLSGQWWRLVSSAFVHIELVHLATNMFLLYFVGKRLEPFIGSGLFLLIYLGCGATGDLAVLAANPQSASYGASAAVAAIAGALLVVYIGGVRQAWYERKTEFAVLALLVVSAPIVDVSRHSHGVHSIALASGAILTWILVRLGRNPRQRIIIGVVFVTLLALATLVLSLRFGENRGRTGRFLIFSSAWPV